jgi:ubiquinone/menaquinone biosynthesis C-methylase UbiE
MGSKKKIRTNRLIKNIKGQNRRLNLSNYKFNRREIYNNLQSNDLISYEEFKQYLKKGNTILNEYNKKRALIEINSALSIMENRYKYYQSPETNKQFMILGKVEDIYIKNRLAEMLYYFVNSKCLEKILLMIQQNKLDTEILEFIKQNTKYNENKFKDMYKMSKIADKIAKYTKHIDKPKILEVGVGAGKKLKKIKEMINCDIYGADIESWGPYKKERNFDFPFKIITLNPYRIDYDDNMFDCITIILTLHHTNIIEVINECKRILKKDGIIVIVEHDIWNDYDNMIIDLQHRIYATIYNEERTNKGKYYNFFEWDIIFNKCNMEPIFGDRITEDIDYSIRYDLQFMGIYKIKNYPTANDEQSE